MTLKSLSKKLLQSTLGLENYLRLFQRYLLFTFETSLTRKSNFFRDKFKDIDCLIEQVAQGDICIDVGANLGLYSIEMAKKIGHTGKVFSFEPMSLNYRVFFNKIKSLKLESVVSPIQKIVSDKIGKMKIAMPNDKGVFFQGLSHVIEDTTITKDLIEEVDSITLDQWFLDYDKKINLIKCDVEGHELSVIRGARQLIQKHRPIILCEIWNSESFDETFNFIEGLKYLAYFIDNQKLVAIDKKETSWKNKNDYFFFPQ